MNERWIQTFIDRVHSFNANAVFLVNDIQSMVNFPDLPDASDRSGVDKMLKDPNIQSEVKFFSQVEGLIVPSLQISDRLTKELALAGKQLTSNITLNDKTMIKVLSVYPVTVDVISAVKRMITDTKIKSNLIRLLFALFVSNYLLFI